MVDGSSCLSIISWSTRIMIEFLYWKKKSVIIWKKAAGERALADMDYSSRFACWPNRFMRLLFSCCFHILIFYAWCVYVYSSNGNKLIFCKFWWLTNRKADECHLLYFWQIPNFIIIFIDSLSFKRCHNNSLYKGSQRMCVCKVTVSARIKL